MSWHPAFGGNRIASHHCQVILQGSTMGYSEILDTGDLFSDRGSGGVATSPIGCRGLMRQPTRSICWLLELVPDNG
ncbi:unnamed protein product [Arctogadus glacialis]